MVSSALAASMFQPNVLGPAYVNMSAPSGGISSNPIQDLTSADLSGSDTQDYASLMDKANEFNSAEAKASRDWYERMSNTSYQRAVADMKAAGLNPALLYANGGGGASSAMSSNAISSGTGSFNVSGLANDKANLELVKAIIGAVANLGSSALKAFK